MSFNFGQQSGSPDAAASGDAAPPPPPESTATGGSLASIAESPAAAAGGAAPTPYDAALERHGVPERAAGDDALAQSMIIGHPEGQNSDPKAAAALARSFLVTSPGYTPAEGHAHNSDPTNGRGSSVVAGGAAATSTAALAPSGAGVVDEKHRKSSAASPNAAAVGSLAASGIDVKLARSPSIDGSPRRTTLESPAAAFGEGLFGNERIPAIERFENFCATQIDDCLPIIIQENSAGHKSVDALEKAVVARLKQKILADPNGKEAVEALLKSASYFLIAHINLLQSFQELQNKMIQNLSEWGGEIAFKELPALPDLETFRKVKTAPALNDKIEEALRVANTQLIQCYFYFFMCFNELAEDYNSKLGARSASQHLQLIPYQGLERTDYTPSPHTHETLPEERKKLLLIIEKELFYILQAISPDIYDLLLQHKKVPDGVKSFVAHLAQAVKPPSADAGGALEAQDDQRIRNEYWNNVTKPRLKKAFAFLGLLVVGGAIAAAMLLDLATTGGLLTFSIMTVAGGAFAGPWLLDKFPNKILWTHNGGIRSQRKLALFIFLGIAALLLNLIPGVGQALTLTGLIIFKVVTLSMVGASAVATTNMIDFEANRARTPYWTAKKILTVLGILALGAAITLDVFATGGLLTTILLAVGGGAFVSPFLNKLLPWSPDPRFTNAKIALLVVLALTAILLNVLLPVFSQVITGATLLCFKLVTFATIGACVASGIEMVGNYLSRPVPGAAKTIAGGGATVKPSMGQPHSPNGGAPNLLDPPRPASATAVDRSRSDSSHNGGDNGDAVIAISHASGGGRASVSESQRLTMTSPGTPVSRASHTSLGGGGGATAFGTSSSYRRSSHASGAAEPVIPLPGSVAPVPVLSTAKSASFAAASPLAAAVALNSGDAFADNSAGAAGRGRSRSTSRTSRDPVVGEGDDASVVPGSVPASLVNVPLDGGDAAALRAPASVAPHSTVGFATPQRLPGQLLPGQLTESVVSGRSKPSTLDPTSAPPKVLDFGSQP